MQRFDLDIPRIITHWGTSSIEKCPVKTAKLKRQRIALRQAPEGPTFNNERFQDANSSPEGADQNW
jgi:hypothetical protein